MLTLRSCDAPESGESEFPSPGQLHYLSLMVGLRYRHFCPSYINVSNAARDGQHSAAVRAPHDDDDSTGR